MSGPLGSSQWMYSSGFYPYEIDQSLRLNDDDSAYLSRTPASAGNRKTWTWSGWVKRGNLGVSSWLFAASTSTSQYTIVRLNSDNTLEYVRIIGALVDAQKITSAVLRDPSAWYHVVVQEDAANTSAKIYINGIEQAYGTNNEPSNVDGAVNNTGAHIISGPLSGIGSGYVDGYMAEVNFIDGTALDPTSFGEFKSGVWIPKKYTGSYGTNGFYLSFADSAAIGDDLSGNGNDWTPSGLASTDVLLDSPTNNYATYNPLEVSGNSASRTFAEGNLQVTAGAIDREVYMTHWPFKVGDKIYAEFTLVAGTTETLVGVGEFRQQYRVNGNIYRDGVLIGAYSPIAVNDIVGVAVDADANTVAFYKNGTLIETLTPTDDLVGSWFYHYIAGIGHAWRANFGQSPFAYTPPAGFLALNTANLPEPTITPARDDVPSDYFNTVLYTGTGTSLGVTGVGFQPDWTWIKERSAARGNALYDVVRGVNKLLSSDATIAELSDSGVNSFDLDGFTVGTAAYVNTSAGSYVAWNWKANGAGVANTDGTISSTVSANQKAGFSVVSYTGNATAGATIGHGLGVTPSMIIAKNRTGAAQNWQVWQASMGDNVMQLNLTNAQVASTSNSVFTVADIDASVFKVGTNASVNGSGTDHIAYCFAEVEGYSKFGSYTGNGSTDGPFVWCGFRPAFVMVKRTDAIGHWIIKDAGRSASNVAAENLYADLSNAEDTVATVNVDLLSNGFKLRGNYIYSNASGGTYIFAAFAENPFKYSNAR